MVLVDDVLVLIGDRGWGGQGAGKEGEEGEGESGMHVGLRWFVRWSVGC